MLYFCFKGDIEDVEALAEKYFDRDNNPNIRSPEELASFHTWRTSQEMGGLRRSFMISEHLGQCVPDSAEDKTFLRTYEDTLERMLEGPNVARVIENALEDYDREHRLIIGRRGPVVYLKTIPAIIPPDIPEFDRDLIRKGSIPIRWPTTNSPFVRFMIDLWEGGWAVYDGKGKPRQDIAYAIMGDKVPKPEGLRAVERTVFVPNVYDLMGIHGINIVGGGSAIEIPPNGMIQEHDEDGKPVGEPFDPNEWGGEDPVPDAARGTIDAKASAVAGMPGYVELGGGHYAHPSGVHTGEPTARACGVEFPDDSMDGL